MFLYVPTSFFEAFGIARSPAALQLVRRSQQQQRRVRGVVLPEAVRTEGVPRASHRRMRSRSRAALPCSASACSEWGWRDGARRPDRLLLQSKGTGPAGQPAGPVVCGRCSSTLRGESLWTCERYRIDLDQSSDHLLPEGRRVGLWPSHLFTRYPSVRHPRRQEVR